MTLHRAFGFPTRPLVRLLERELFGKHVLDVDIGRHSWIVHRYATGDGNIAAADALGRHEQIPLRLAYALTAHGVQGKTFDEVVFDPAPPRGRVAVPGMLYAMVSRCRTSTGLHLVRPVDVAYVSLDNDALAEEGRHVAGSPACLEGATAPAIRI